MHIIMVAPVIAICYNIAVNWGMFCNINPSVAETDILQDNYHKISNMSHTQSQNLNVSCLGLQVFGAYIEARC